MLKAINNPIVRQYVVVISVNLVLLSTGLGLAWPSPMLVKLRNSNETVLERPVTEEEGSWIVSAGFLASSLMNFIPALLLDRLGRKYSIMVAAIPKVVGAFLMLFATKVWILILGRILNSIAGVFIFTVVPTYASEIASKEVRGSLSTILQVMCSLGNVIMLSVGPFVSYFAANILHVSVILVALLPVPFLPESPYFLYEKRSKDESVKVLTLLRGSEAAANEELKDYEAANSGKEVKKLELFKNRIFWKSLSLVVVLTIGGQLIGYQAVIFYLQTVFESTHTSVRPEIASVIIGMIQLLASILTSLITDKFGRKPILSTSLIGMMVGMISLGVFFHVTEGTDVIRGFMNYLPLVALTLVVFCYSSGSGSVNWALAAELFDGKGRAVGISLGLLISTLSTFFLTRFFPTLMTTVGPAVTYWVFSVNCLLLCAFVLICIPETKGKSFIEIQRELGAKIETDEAAIK